MNIKIGGKSVLLWLLITAFAVAAIASPASLPARFLLAVFPLAIVFVGIIAFRQSGARMAVVGWIAALALAVLFFHTELRVAIGASIYGIFKSFGITIAVLATMLMIFIMKEAKALNVISDAVRRAAVTKEEQAIFIGIGFGSFVTSLGVVTPSLFPPFLVALGFDPFSAISVAVLGYNATTSFALLSIPVTLPAGLFGIDARLLAYKICLYLPVVATLISIAMLYMIGGKESARKSWPSAIIAGLSLGFSALIFSIIGVPVPIIGVLAGAFTMVVLYSFFRAGRKASAKDGAAEGQKQKMDWKAFFRAASPWLALITFALVISVPSITNALKAVDGNALYIFGKPVDFDFLIQIYTWILIATLVSLPLLKIDGAGLKRACSTWSKRILQPFLAYSLFFAIAYIMAWSAMGVVNGNLSGGPYYDGYNMNLVVANTIAGAFGASFVFVAAWLGLFGAVVGGSEAGSNVMFYPIQKGIADKIGLADSQFLTTYAAHANGGGIASAITPSKINNAAVTISAGSDMESMVLRKHLLAVIAVTIITGILNALFVYWSL